MPDPLFSVADKVILCTGGAGALGSAIAAALAERGARVILTDIDLDRAKRVATGLPPGSVIQTQALDIRDEDAVTDTLEAIAKTHGRLDGLINAAGNFLLAPVTEMSKQDFCDAMDTNLVGAFLLTRAAARVMGAGTMCAQACD